MPNQPDLDPTVVIPLPQRTLAAFDALENAGFETWIVGGYVRNALLGRPSSDIDIATQAHWQDVQRVFEGQGYRTHETGTAHGTLTVIVDEQALEVTTYRSDGAYADARHPNQVSFVRTIAEDLARLSPPGNLRAVPLRADEHTAVLRRLARCRRLPRRGNRVARVVRGARRHLPWPRGDAVR